MTARCIYKTGNDLVVPSRKAFHSEETVFDITVGDEYQVLGLGIFDTILLALVCDDSGGPSWLPVGLFELAAQPLPVDWEFSLRNGMVASGGETSDGWVAMWGYSELVRDPRHSDRLLERDPAAVGVFRRELAK